MKNKNVSHGNQSVNIGKAKNVNVNYADQTEVVDVTDRKTLKQIDLRPSNVAITGYLGATATTITISSAFTEFPIKEPVGWVILVALVFFIGLAALGSWVYSKRFLPILGSYSVESNGHDMSIKRTSYRCAKCGSGVSVFMNRKGNVYWCCTRNSVHGGFFDYTTLDNL